MRDIVVTAAHICIGAMDANAEVLLATRTGSLKAQWAGQRLCCAVSVRPVRDPLFPDVSYAGSHGDVIYVVWRAKSSSRAAIESRVTGA